VRPVSVGYYRLFVIYYRHALLLGLFVPFPGLRANQALLSPAEVLPSGYLVLDAQLFLPPPGNRAV